MSLPLQTVPGAFWGGVRMTQDGANVLVTLGWKQIGAGGSDQTIADAIATATATEWASQIMPSLNSACVGVETFCYPLGTPTLPASIAPMSAVGGIGSPQAGDQMCALITHHVPLRGKGRQGRSYIPLGTSLDVNADGRTLVSGYLTALQTKWNSFVSNVASDVAASVPAGIQFGVLSRVHASMSAVAVSTVETVIATQRRRLVR